MKTKIGIYSFFLSIFLFSYAIAQTTTASLLPNAVQQFFDNNGNPLTKGTVTTYQAGTFTLAVTWKDSAETIPNTNPIILDAGGKAIIYGNQTYRQVVKDRNGNLIWDAVTAPGGGGGSTPTLVGDGNLVGTVLPWSGLIAPNQYVFAAGQEISRTTFPEFYTATTQLVNVICSASSNILTGISDTTQIRVGSPVELALCVVPGTTVVSKTVSTVTLSNPSSVSINSVATFFPFGNGNASTTFNVPDLRGYAVAGRDNMGGTAAGRLTSTYFANPGLGAFGGSQSHTQTISELAAHGHSINDPGHSHTIPTSTNQNIGTGGPGTYWSSGSSNPLTSTATTGITTATITGASAAFSIVQPTITLNYVVKVTPDTSTSIATGVYSIGGMTGVISCGSGILCTGNIISFNASTFAGGLNTNVQYNNAGAFAGSPNFSFISPDNLTLGAVGVQGKFDIFGSSSGRIRQVAPAAAGTTNITWGNNSGTPGVTASTPLSLNTTTGDVSCPTCATGSLNGQALTRVNDTNVTLTLGGSPNTALLTPSSLTLGWTGTLAAARLNSNVVQSITNDTNVTGVISAQNLTLGWTGTLAVGRGGTGLSSGTSGGILYFNSTSTLASSALLTANQIMIGGGAGVAPSTFACATTTTVVHGGTPPTCGQIVNADITTNTISNSSLAQAGAATFKGNPTASTANLVDFTLSSLTQTISPGSTDWIPIFDNATGTIKKVNAGSIASSSVAGVASLNGLTGALSIANGRGIAPINLTSPTIGISADIATTANFEAGTTDKLLSADVVFSPETTTTFGTTIAFDFNTFINTKVTLTNNITTMNCSNMKASQSGIITFIQDGTGSRTAAFNTGTCSTVLKFAGATFPTLTTSASAIDVLSYSCRSSTYCPAALSKGYNP